MWKCYSNGNDIIIFIYLSLQQFVGIILAILTCKVKMTALNDSKSATALIYTSSIALVVIFLVSFLLRDHINTMQYGFI